MKREEFALNQIMIASPCSIGWENMEGDERVRFCNACQLNVYNTSQMSKNEVELLLTNGKSNCLRIYRRADGTMMTNDCPVGLRRVRNAAKRMTKRLTQVTATIWTLALSLNGAMAQFYPKKIQIEPEQPSSMKNRTSAAQLLHQPHDKSNKLDTSLTLEQRADATAYKYLQTARAKVTANQSAEAEENFMNASIALSKVRHDPTFANQVWEEFADFLQTQNRISEAAAIRKMVKETTRKNKDTVFVVDGGAMPSSRSQPMPTLPGGAPIPDKE